MLLLMMITEAVLEQAVQAGQQLGHEALRVLDEPEHVPVCEVCERL